MEFSGVDCWRRGAGLGEHALAVDAAIGARDKASSDSPWDPLLDVLVEDVATWLGDA